MADSEKKVVASENELPPEFKKFDKPLGFEQWHMNQFILVLCHIHFFHYVCYLLPFGLVPKGTVLLGLVYAYFGYFGNTAGAHRYWSHKSFKAKTPLRILMMIAQTASFQYPIFKWSRDHRVHHKYCDTDADPHNASRGFWFSHMTYLTQPPHPLCREKLNTIDVSDLIRDPVVRFQSKYYYPLMTLMLFVVPITLCHLIYPEMSLCHLLAWNGARYCYNLHTTFIVNSVAHMWGDKPYDKYIRPVDNKLVSLFAIGEGWHNYHHVFPWDYKTGEIGKGYNFTAFCLDFFAKIGWAYDLKTVSHKMLVDRLNRTGDGTHPLHKVSEHGKKLGEDDIVAEAVWGWDDKGLKKEDKDIAETLFPLKERQG